jgi:hypothetical protein
MSLEKIYRPSHYVKNADGDTVWTGPYREELAYWKQRALAAEEKLQRIELRLLKIQCTRPSPHVCGKGAKPSPWSACNGSPRAI